MTNCELIEICHKHITIASIAIIGRTVYGLDITVPKAYNLYHSMDLEFTG